MFELPLKDNAVLRPLEPWRAEEFLENMDRSRDHISPWVGATFPASTLDEARAVLQRYADGAAKDRQRIYGIWLDGVLVGGTMFVSFDAADGVCEVGVWLQPDAEGQGLVTMAVEKLLEWAFEVRGLVRAEWRTIPENGPSVAVAERLEMRREGLLRQLTPRGGGRADEAIYAILADEWRERRSSAGSR
ncbi:GNAT family N-acetyltransferase [Salininema proteolyticum]|uniref:GNAT family N-acetyltransferase n=1 Tax=Salininema proteolyticum TaxID=1607685 RepID=A0ABV8TXU9_9ACTN